MAETKIKQYFNLLKTNPRITDAEAAEIVDTTPGTIEQYRYRLRNKGIIQINKDKSIEVLEELPANRSYKQQILEEMVDTYMEDFRNQTTFADRLAVGREIRLIIERM